MGKTTEVGIIGLFSKKGQRIIFQYPNLLLSQLNSYHHSFPYNNFKKNRKIPKKRKDQLKKEALNYLLKKDHLFCTTLSQNPVLEKLLKSALNENSQINEELSESDLLALISKYYQATNLNGQISREQLLGINREKMMLLISKKQEEGLHIVRLDNVLLFGFRRHIKSRFKRDIEDGHVPRPFNFLGSPTNFRTVTEEYNMKNRPVLKSIFVYYVEKQVINIPTKGRPK